MSVRAKKTAAPNSNTTKAWGGFLLADVMVALVIVGVTKAPLGLPARLLSLRPLIFVGRISYGLYLWHWPIFVLARYWSGKGPDAAETTGPSFR